MKADKTGQTVDLKAASPLLLKEAQYRLKMQGLGALGFSFVHDICNTLMTVLGHTELAKVKVQQDFREVGSHLGEIEAAARRASDLCRQLLDSAQDRLPGGLSHRAEDLLRGMRPLLSMILPKETALRLEIPPNLPEICGDIGQIHDRLLELIVRVIGSSSQPIPTLVLRLGFSGAEAQALFFEADTGFSRQRQLFPLAGQDPAPEAEAGSTPDHLWSARGRILLVDDEGSVRAVARQMLERIGFDVESAVDGCDAVELMEQGPDRFCCVLLDMSMPNMNGDSCFFELRRMRPDLPVIFASGSGDNHLLEPVMAASDTAFINKPYSMASLRRELQRLMEPGVN